MKELIFNDENVKDMEINAVVTRVKVLMINSENKVLLGYCDGIYQFPGGHVEDGEALNVAVRREVKEETGIELDTINMTPFYCIKHYKRKYDGTNICALSQLYYFLVKTDAKINMENIKYTEREKRGVYRLEYVPIENLKETVKSNIPNNIHNSTIVKEMLAVIDESGIMCGETKYENAINHLGTMEINTARLTLRKFKESDAEELYNGYMNQEEFLYYAHKERKNVEEIRELLKRKIERYYNVEYYNWVITLKETGEIVGAINLNVNDYNDSVEFNYAIDNRYTNKGYMTEALEAIENLCLDELKVNRFQGGCCVENIASKRVMEKCKMECEGILKKYIKLRDGYHDMYMFSMTNK